MSESPAHNGLTLTAALGMEPAPNLFGGITQAPWLPTPPPPLDPERPIDLPEGLKLYDFQAEGIRFLMAQQAALLGDEMGLGKSIQAILACRALLCQGEVNKALVLCPKSVLFDWEQKFRKWAPDLRTVVVEGPKKRRHYYWWYPGHVKMASYESWQRDRQHVEDKDFDLVILDEIQRIKNRKTQLYQAVTELTAAFRWGLSGTPLENKLQELVNIFRYLRPGLIPAEAEQDPDRVRELIRPHVLRRTKDAVLPFLPPKVQDEVWLELTPAQRRSYDRVLQAGLSQIQGLGAPALLALINQLKQICNLDPATGESTKLNWLLQRLPEITAKGEKALIFSQYPEKCLAPLAARLSQYHPFVFDGRLSHGQRADLIYCFQHLPYPQVLLMSLKAGGVGVTLTRATHVFHFDSWWNWAATSQAEDRAHRIGQTQPVFVTTLYTKGTIEERIYTLLAEKRQLFYQVMDGVTDNERGGQTLSREELLELLHPTHETAEKKTPPA